MKIKNIKKRLEIINEKIERIEELEQFVSVALDDNNEYYRLFGNEAERRQEINAYKLEIKELTNGIDAEIELLNKLK